jgi:hypothetical protein
MIVTQLIDRLSTMPPDAEVWLETRTGTFYQWDYSLARSIYPVVDQDDFVACYISVEEECKDQ